MDRGDRTGICGCEGTWGIATAERDDGPEKFNEKLGRLSKWARLLRIWYEFSSSVGYWPNIC